MKRLIGAMAFAFVFLTFAVAVNAVPNGNNKLLCFDGSTDYPGEVNGHCTMADGVATLATEDGYAGLYTEGSNLDGKLLADIGQLSFRYSGDAPGAGAPRISLPIDTDGDGEWDLFGFISAYYCNDGSGLVDAINDETCTIWAGAESFANWDAMVTAHPDWRVGDYYTFIVADEPGTWQISDVRFGRNSRTTGK